jgi:Tol biopolymer transport system component
VLPPSQDATFDICVDHPDGKGWQRHKTEQGNDSEPTWSPDGMTIAFISNRSQQSDVYTMQPDGSDQRRLTPNGGVRDNLTWSPNGEFIAYTAETTEKQIHKVNVRSLQVIQLTSISNNFNPQWSPNGEQIAFVSDRDGNFEIYIMRADGTEQRNVSSHPAYDQNPAWSPDGTHLAFDRELSSAGDRAIYSFSVSGREASSSFIQWTHDGRQPTWSPDGTRLGFVSDRPESTVNALFAVIAREGSTTEIRIANKNTLLRLAWSPDSSKIVFTSYDDFQGRPIPKLWLVSADGTELNSLTPVGPDAQGESLLSP